jgi:hypothetical protein
LKIKIFECEKLYSHFYKLTGVKAITPVVRAITPVVRAITPVVRAITPVQRQGLDILFFKSFGTTHISGTLKTEFI